MPKKKEKLARLADAVVLRGAQSAGEVETKQLKVIRLRAELAALELQLGSTPGFEAHLAVRAEIADRLRQLRQLGAA
jgi:hypothetical protein